MEKIYCDVCNRCLTEEIDGKNTTCTGHRYSLTSIPEDYPFTERDLVIKEFGKAEFNVCWLCVLKNAGIKTINN